MPYDPHLRPKIKTTRSVAVDIAVLIVAAAVVVAAIILGALTALS
jgi:hypothetical protein